MASNMMELMKSKFAAMSEDKLSLTARQANDDLAGGFLSLALNNGKMELIVLGNFAMQSCLKLGFCTRQLSAKQQWLMKELYGTSEETRNAQSEAAVEPIEATDYKMIETFAGYGRQISEGLFNLIMCAAYADSGLKPEVEAKIDPIFGMLFLALFGESGMESVPAPGGKPRVTGLEAKVLDFMLKKGHMMPLNEIAKAFPGETKAAVKKALDGLCEKDLVHWLFNVIGEPYSADVDRETVDIVLTEEKEKAPAKPKKSPEELAAEKKRKEEIAKAAAEKKAAEEAKKQRKEEEKKAYHKALGEWKQAVQKTEAARKNELSRRRKAQEKTLTKEYQKEYEAAIDAANKAGNAARDKKKQAEETLASLGAFKFSEKKAQRALIAEAEAEMAAAEQAVDAAKAAKADALAVMEELLDQYVETQVKDVERRFPLQMEPKKPKTNS